MYSVFLRPHARRALKKLQKTEQIEITQALELLAENPFASPNVDRIEGSRDPAFRLRVGRYRALYILITSNHTIEVIDVFLKTGNQDYRQRL